MKKNGACMLKRSYPLLIAASMFAVFACAQSATIPTNLPTKADGAYLGPWGLKLGSIDTAIRPGDNFFLYAEGEYVKSLVIPPDRVDEGLLEAMAARHRLQIADLIKNEVARPGLSPSKQKVAALYRAYMDEKLIATKGVGPLQPDLNRIRGVRSKSEMSVLMGQSLGRFGAAIYDIHISPDDKDTTRYAINIHQSGLGLPDRSYYVKPELAGIRVQYQSYIEQMLRLISWPNPEVNAAAVLAFESRIAQDSWTDQERRDPDKTYNLRSKAELDALTGHSGVDEFLAGAGVGGENWFIVDELSAVSKLANVFTQTPLDTLKAWEAFRVVDQAAPLLPDRFVDAHFQFRRKVLAGQQQLAPRWQRAISVENSTLEEAVGRIYVEHYFSEQSKLEMLDMVARLKHAMRQRIEEASWLSAPAKQEALKKLDAMSVGIGYPDRWKSFAFAVSPRDLYGDVERGRMWQHREDLSLLHRGVDRLAWGLAPQSMGSEYNSSLNRITFPAANLQPPFFDPKADAAVNYGAIGVVIGHELTHGFDDQGRKTDSTGRLRDWWTSEDAKRFNSQAQVIATQYSSFEPLPGLHVNGEATLGEDLADTGGLALALDAYHSLLGNVPAPLLDGFTGDQRFFLSCAQVWAGKIRSDALRQDLLSDPHPPGEVRVNGEVRNIDAWYSAFDIKLGDKLYVAPDKRVHLW